SAVAEHRRAVRPSRRTQGSRNPLRALAAREDIRQDYMGDRDNNAAEERGQAEKNCKNSSSPNSRPVTSSDKEITKSFPPFSNLMLIHIKGAGAPEEDELFEQGVVESNCVYSLVEDRLVPHELAWASIPSTSLLGSSEVLVFDFGSEVYLWHGRDVSLGRKNVALQLTHQVWVGEFDYSNCRVNPLDPTQCNLSVQPRGQGRPSWALLAVVSEDNETALFREKFLGPMCGSEDTVEVASERDEMQVNLMVQWFRATMQHTYSHSGIRWVMELRTVSVDTWHVQEFDDSEIPVESTGQLHEGDSYVIRWTYSISAVAIPGRPGHSQGKPRGTHLHCRCSKICFCLGFYFLPFSNFVTEISFCFPTTDWRLFCVRGELPEEALLLEGGCCCSSLRSRGCIVLLNSQQGVLYLWTGCKAHSSTREVSKRAVERLTQM
ncbi:hypothetical protein GOODEAATRI_005579, partial [Goodea atripinnis]